MSQPQIAQPNQDPLSEIDLLKREIHELQVRLARNEKIKQTLMERVERSMETAGNAYTLFERNILLEQSVSQRTAELKESETAYKTLFEQSPYMVVLNKRSGEFVDVNDKFCAFCELPREQVIGKTLVELGMLTPGQMEDILRTMDQNGGSLENFEISQTTAKGHVYSEQLSSRIIEFHGSSVILSIIQDITERKQTLEQIRLNEQRLATLFQLNQMTEEPLEILCQYAMEQAVHLTGSTLGYLAFVNEDETVLTMHAWSRSAMQQCRIENKSIVYPVEKTGLWGEAIRQRRPVITNDYSQPNPHKKGCPQGHVAVHRHMNAPIFDGDRIVVVAGVGNKATDYDDTDVRQLTLLMQGMWSSLRRKQAEEALRKNEERYRTIVEHINDALYIHDFDGILLDVNDNTCKLLGYSRDELIGSHLSRFDGPENVRQIAEHMQTLINTGQLLFDGEHIRKDGTLVPTTVSARVVSREGRGIVQSFIRDSTWRKRAEEALRIERQRLASIIEGTDVGTWEWNVQTGETVFNERWAEMVGYTLAEIRPTTVQTWKDLTHPEDLKVAEELLRNHFAGQLEGYDCEYRMKNKNGSWIWIHDRGKVMEWTADGKPLRMFGTHSDITERKRAEEALRESEQKARAFFDSSFGFVGLLSADGTVLEINKTALDFAGISMSDVEGKPFWDTVWWSHSSRMQDLVRANIKSAAEGTLIRGEAIHPAKDGTVHTIDFTIKPIPDETGRIVHLIAEGHDITDRKQAEEELRRAVEAANAANIAKSQFLANMSHEIRTPMNAILGFADLLAQDELSSQQSDYVQTIRNSGTHLLELINDILDFSKIEAGKMTLEFTDCSPADLLNELESLMTPFAKTKGLRFEMLEPTALPRQIRTDPVRLRQCLMNLVNNAIKFTEAGHVIVRTMVSESGGKPFLCFEVEDTGPGIDPLAQARIFEAFEQADGSMTRKYGGTGLGLTITRHLAELMGGTLTLTSELGRGSTFVLEIPANMEEQDRPIRNRHDVQNQEKLSESMSPHFQGRVLVAEDVKTNQMLVRILLNQVGLQPVMVEDGQAALEQALRHDFDLILMDMQMPRLNGFEATRKLRHQGVQVPIVALTAAAIKGDEDKCLQAGCDEYLTKPIDRTELHRVLTKYLQVVEPLKHPV